MWGTENPCVAGSIPARATCYYEIYNTQCFPYSFISMNTIDYNSPIVEGFIIKNAGLELISYV